MASFMWVLKIVTATELLPLIVVIPVVNYNQSLKLHMMYPLFTMKWSCDCSNGMYNILGWCKLDMGQAWFELEW
jgi:hypothetical protein